MCSGIKVTVIVMQLSVSMCVIGSLICNPNDKLHVILTILLLQFPKEHNYNYN